MRTVFVGQKKARIGDRDLLGAGGEAEVFRFDHRALKIYHALEPDRLVKRLAKVLAFPRGLPKEVLGPEELVTDEKDQPIGFVMPLAENAVEILHLGRRQFREGKISGDEVLAIFSDLRRLLVAIHEKSVIAGDLNDGNILISPADRRIFLIDADSMQFGNYPCEVGHEKYLDPRLHGVDLSARCSFDMNSDWYAFAVLLFSSLMYVHPYGGAHQKYPTLLRRAEARYSILRDDVKRPKIAEDPRILPAALHGWFEAVFDRGARLEPPPELFAGRFFAPAVAKASVVEKKSGRCRAIRIAAARGRILAATVQHGKLRYVYEDGGTVRRENGERVLDEFPSPQMRFAISGDRAWVAMGGELVAIEREHVTARARTGMFRGTPVFDATSDELFSLDGENLRSDNLALGKILEDQTWFRVSERAGFGFWIAGRSTFYFVFSPKNPGLIDVRLPPISGRIVDADVVFAENRILFSLVGRMELLDSRGNSIARMEGDHRALEHARGKVLSGDRVLVATDDGVLALEADRATGTFVESAVFTDTEPFVRSGDELYPAPNGALYVVSEREIRELIWE